MQSSSNGDEAITSINITPLVDIILVVLIIFMATAPLISKRALKVEVPKAAHHERTATDTLQILFDAQRQVALGGKLTTTPELVKTLSALSKGQPDLHVSLSADKTLPYGEVVGLLDAVRGAGVRKIGLEVK